jgi:NADH-quinone oxidoreductase subunit J
LNLTIPIILAASMVLFAFISVFIRSLVKAAIALGIASAILTVIMFLLKAPLAAVFELSVCAGLITVVFISAISLTKPRSREEIKELTKYRFKRFISLPFILIAASIVLYILWKRLDIDWAITNMISSLTVQQILWDYRQVDILGQVIIIFVGAVGILVLFKERNQK